MPQNYVQGMSGPSEAIVWTLDAPNGVDFTTVSAISLSSKISSANGSVRYLTAWTFAVLSASQLRATLIPTGGEFPSAEIVTTRTTLTLDDTEYRYAKTTESVDAY